MFSQIYTSALVIWFVVCLTAVLGVVYFTAGVISLGGFTGSGAESYDPNKTYNTTDEYMTLFGVWVILLTGFYVSAETLYGRIADK